MSEDHFERPTTVLLEISDQEWKQWQHGPISKAFFQFLEDQLTVFREAAADLLEQGYFTDHDPNPDRNPEVVRGRLLTLRELARIELQPIQAFYGKEPPEEPEAGIPDE